MLYIQTARNAFGHVAAIPYYIWLGCKAHRDLPERLSAFGADPLTPAFSPTLSVTTPNLELIPELTLSPALAPTLPRSSSITTMNLPSSRRAGKTNSVIDMVPPPSPLLEPTMAGTPLSAFYYQKHNYRMPYHHGNDQKLFRSWIYGFTWEDPVDDMHRMKIAKTDTVLCITSAGDNALHYAIKGQPKRIHCVDSEWTCDEDACHLPPLTQERMLIEFFHTSSTVPLCSESLPRSSA